MRNKRGITLIALVVTIIVLLILAGVVISLVIGQNGIISKVEEAKNNTIAGQEEENRILNDYANKIEEYTGNKNNGGNSGGGDSENEDNKQLDPEYQENTDTIEPINDWQKVETVTTADYPLAAKSNLREKKTNTFASNVVGVKLVFTDLFVEMDDYRRFDKVVVENKYSEQIATMSGRANESHASVTARSSLIIKGNFYKILYLTDGSNEYIGYSCDVYITTNEELVKEDDKPITQYYYDRVTAVPMYFNGYDREKEVNECIIAEGEGDIPIEVFTNYALPKLEGETNSEWEERATTLNGKFLYRIEIYNGNNELLYERDLTSSGRAWGAYPVTITTLDSTKIDGKIRIEITTNLSISSQFTTAIVGKQE